MSVKVGKIVFASTAAGSVTLPYALGLKKKPMHPITKIIMHHSLTEDSGTVSWGAIRQFHIKVHGWKDIGYHYGVELVNFDYEILVGRFEDHMGAHTLGHNDDSIGVCVVGNWDKLRVPKQQWLKSLALVRDICKRYGLKASDVYGHRDFANKSCPGINFSMEQFREDLNI